MQQIRWICLQDREKKLHKINLKKKKKEPNLRRAQSADSGSAPAAIPTSSLQKSWHHQMEISLKYPERRTVLVIHFISFDCVPAKHQPRSHFPPPPVALQCSTSAGNEGFFEIKRGTDLGAVVFSPPDRYGNKFRNNFRQMSLFVGFFVFFWKIRMSSSHQTVSF